MYRIRGAGSDPDPAWLWVAAVLAGLALLIYSLVGGVQEVRFAVSGQETQAVVTDVWGGDNTRPTDGSTTTTSSVGRPTRQVSRARLLSGTRI